MTTPTPPAVSDAMREAVARWLQSWWPLSDRAALAHAGDLLELGPIASEIARLTAQATRRGEWRDRWLRAYQRADKRNREEIARLTGENADLLAQHVIENDRMHAAEAETARLREAARCVHDTFARDIAQGYRTKDKDFAVSVLSVALTSQEKTDG